MIVAFVLTIDAAAGAADAAAPAGERHGRGRLRHAGAGRRVRACGSAARGRWRAALRRGDRLVAPAAAAALRLRSAQPEEPERRVDGDPATRWRSDPDWTPNAIDVLAPSLAAAEPLARRLAALPEVSRTVTLASFVPDQQPAKLALIGDAAELLDADPRRRSASRRRSRRRSCSAAWRRRRRRCDRRRPAATDAAAASARRLADALERLQRAAPDVRAAAAAAVVDAAQGHARPDPRARCRPGR